MKNKHAKYLYRLLYLGMYTTIMGFLLSCASNEDSSTPSPPPHLTGQSGSIARFKIINNHLFSIQGDSLNITSLANPEQPKLIRSIKVGKDVETLFSYQNYLFIGKTDGVDFYDVKAPMYPVHLSTFSHLLACDPVVGNETRAYVSLYSENKCDRNINQLDILNIENIKHPELVNSIQLQNPRGLALRDSILFLCNNGLEVYNINHPDSLQLVNKYEIEGEDIIAVQNSELILMISEKGLFQYNYSPKDNKLKLLSLFSIKNSGT